MFKRSLSSIFNRSSLSNLGIVALLASLSVGGTLMACGSDGGGDSGGGGTETDASVPDGQTPQEAGDDSAIPDSTVDAPMDVNKPDTKQDSSPTGDSDGDGVPDSQDKCPGYDDNVDSDGDGTPDGCELCPGQDERDDNNGNGVPDCAEHVKLWLRADMGVMTEKDGAGADAGADADTDGGVSYEPAADGQPVAVWKDRALGGRDAVQLVPNARPTWVKSFGSSGPTVRFKIESTSQPDAGDSGTTATGNYLDGPSLLQGGDARTIFIVARQDETQQNTNVSLLQLNRAPLPGSGGSFRVSSEVGVRLFNGNIIFGYQPLGPELHIITLDMPQGANASAIRAWYDGIPANTSALTNILVNTGTAGYRIGNGRVPGPQAFAGDISEVLVYDTQLIGRDRNAVGYDLEKRHDLATSYVPPADPPVEIPIYMVLGGDNAAGEGQVDVLAGSFKAMHSDIMFWQNQTKGFLPLAPGFGQSSEKFGPELTMGPELLGKSEQPIIFFKHAVPTSTIDQWDPSGGPVYSHLVSELTAARDKLDASSFSYKIMGVAWIHGEQDAMDQSKAAFYENGLGNLVLSLRNYLGETNLPFVITTLPKNLPSTEYGYASVVSTAQTQVASTYANVKVVDTADVSVGSDNVHYDTFGQMKLGTKLATTLKSMKP